MAKLGRKRAGKTPHDSPEGDSTPTYLRPRFVAGVVLLAILAGYVMFRLGSTGSVDLSAETGSASPVVDVQDEAAPPSTDPDDCPQPDERVELDAAELLRVFEAAVADPAVGDIPATAEVQAQLDANAPSPPLSRMTRIRGFAGGAGSWSTCVLSYWMGSDGPMRSLDVVTVEVVSGTDRSDTPSSTSRSRRGSDTPSDRWEVTRWLRGEPVRAPRGRAVPVAFFNGSGCSNPDREVSVPVPDGAPGDRVVSALEELISGPVGRSPTASTLVPSDLQVLEASVEGPRATVVLTRTSDSGLSRCEGTGALAQVVETTEAVLAETVDPDGGADLDVEVIIDGEPVDTLRR
ncbi:MAG: GerMN domain-containing protein [Microthrixaceae bacterium]